LRAPIAFRSATAPRWVQGNTVNISRSGVLFVASGPSALDGDVEFVINLSRGALQGPGVPLLPDLHCQGRVVRCREGTDEVEIAATIRRQSIRKALSFVLATPGG
jgi:hypothetical protein